jgi:hypothetical protein
MSKRFETASSRDNPPKLLIFPTANWDQLPPEIRFSQPWYDSGFCDEIDLTAAQRHEVARFGYSLVYGASAIGVRQAP